MDRVAVGSCCMEDLDLAADESSSMDDLDLAGA